METIPITEAKARIAELADRVAREHDHFAITRNGRADVMLISVAEYESMQETLDILGDEQTLADLRQSREDFAGGDTFDAGQIRAELEQRRRGAPGAASREPPVPRPQRRTRSSSPGRPGSTCMRTFRLMSPPPPWRRSTDRSPPTRTASASHWMSPSTGTTQHDAEPTGSSTASTRTSTPSRSTPSGTGATHTAPDLRVHRLAPPRHPRRNPARYYWASIRNLAGPRAGDARRGQRR